jgi:tetratricopeptide (TPR) repeat protein
MIGDFSERGGTGIKVSTRTNLGRACYLVGTCFFTIGLAGCQAVEPAPPPETVAGAPEVAVDTRPPLPATIQNPGDVKYFPSDEPLHLAIQYFKDGSYGLAERYFRDAVQRAPKDVTAWLGLAASYDRLGRFDLADRAYRSAIKLRGETIEILNNEGYSYMLRGDLVKARWKFQAALRLDPENATIINNLHLLDSSAKYIERPPG